MCVCMYIIECTYPSGNAAHTARLSQSQHVTCMLIVLLYHACNVMEYQSSCLFNYELFYIVGLYSESTFIYLMIYIENMCYCTNWNTTCSIISYSMVDSSCHTSGVVDTPCQKGGVIDTSCHKSGVVDTSCHKSGVVDTSCHKSGVVDTSCHM